MMMYIAAKSMKKKPVKIRYSLNDFMPVLDFDRTKYDHISVIKVLNSDCSDCKFTDGIVI